MKGIPTGTVLFETSYLASGIVDSTQERPGDGGKGPAATTGP